MLGRWLALLTPQEEDNLLTTKLVPFASHSRIGEEDVGCLVGVALRHDSWGLAGARTFLWVWWNNKRAAIRNPATRFNELCQKLAGIPVRQRKSGACFDPRDPRQILGGAPAADFILTRILKHRAARELAGVRPSTPVATEAVARAWRQGTPG